MSGQKGITITINAETADAAAKLQRFFQVTSQGLERLSGAGELLKGFGGKIAGLVSAGALIEFTRSAIEAADHLGKLSQVMGVAVDKLSGLSVAAKLANLSTEDLAIAVSFLSQNITAAGAGNREAKRLFDDLGIGIRSTSGALVSADEALAQISDRFSQMQDGVSKTSLAQDLFGRSGRNLIPLLNQGSESLRSLREEAQSYGLSISPEFARRAEELNDQLTRFGLIAKGVFMQLANALLPEMLRLSSVVLDLIRGFGVHNALVGTILDIYKTLAAAVAIVASSFEMLGAFIGAFAGNLSTTGNPMSAWIAGASAFDEKLKTLQERLKQIAALGQETGGEGSVRKETADLIEQRRQIKANMDEQRRLLDLRIQENRLITAAIQADQALDPEAKQKRLNAQLAVEIGLIDKKRQLSTEAKNAGAITFDDFRAFELSDKKDLLAAQTARTPEDIAGNFRLVMRQMLDEWGTLASQMANMFRTVLSDAISTVSAGITSLIMGTKSWAQALREVGTSILTSVINAIVQMGVRWILTHTLMAAAGKSVQAGTVAASAPIAAAQSAIWATPAALSTIASYGGAAEVAPGLIAASIALTQGITSASAGAGLVGYAEGGRPTPGQVALVGENGPELFIPDSSGTILPADVTSAYMKGQKAAGSGQSTRFTKEKNNINLAIFNDDNDIPRWASTVEGETHIVNIVKKNWHQIA